MTVLRHLSSKSIRRSHALVITIGALLMTALGCGSESGNSGTASTSGDGGSSGGLASGGGEAGGSGGATTGGTSSATGGGAAAPTLADCSIFPSNSPWNTDVSGLPVHPNSDAYVDSIGRSAHVHPDFGTEWEGAPIGIPYVVVDDDQPPVAIDYQAYGDESDPGPFPIPPNAPVEGGPNGDGDRHVIVIDAASCTLYELFRAFPVEGGSSWQADSGVAWDLDINDTHPEGCTSADAAGLPIFPGLVRYDEVVEQGEVRHAIRFTVQESQRAYVAPASHYASSDTSADLPPLGQRFRMKADYDCSTFSMEAQVICTALKTYGLIVADNGSNWYLSGAPDPRWDDDALGDLKSIPGDAFEALDTGAALVTDAPDCTL